MASAGAASGSDTSVSSGNPSVSDITKCSICLDTWNDPRSPPCCDHTFCLQCLKTNVEKLNEKGEKIRCPCCRRVFSVPVGGLDMLPKNFMHQQLLDACNADAAAAAGHSLGHEHHEQIPVCELCVNNITATGYCIQCGQNICTTCTTIHLHANANRNHEVVVLGEKHNQFNKQLSRNCKQHAKQRVEWYCNELNCKKLFCTICRDAEHVGHKYMTIKKAAQGFADQISGCHVKVDRWIAKTEEHLCQIDQDRNRLSQMVTEKEKKLQEKETEMIRLIKAEHEQLWSELKQMKERRLKAINMKEEEITTELSTLQTFKKTSKELIEMNQPVDICLSVNNLLTQADAFANSPTVSTTKWSHDQTDICFTPATIPNVDGYDIHFVGLLHCTDVTADKQNKRATTMDILYANLETQVKERNDKITSLETQVKERNDMITSLKIQVKARSDKITSLETQIKERNDNTANLEIQFKERSDKITSLEKQLEQAEEKYSRLKKEYEPVTGALYLQPPPVVHVIEGKAEPSGIAVIDSELFVARHGGIHVEVYDVNNFNTTPRLLTISDKILCAPRLAACSYWKCLYLRHWSNARESVIYRLGLPGSSVPGSVSCWKVRGNSGRLSVTKDHNLLVTLYQEKKVVEYTTTGEFRGEIILHESIVHPKHCVQLSTGNFVVCHKGSTQHRVCLVDKKGLIRNSYGGSPGSGVGQFNDPCELSVDKYDQVFVADYNNNRILLLSPTLDLVGAVQTPGQQLNGPLTVHLDEIKHLLFIGEHWSWERWGKGRVIVVAVSPPVRSFNQSMQNRSQ